MPGTKIESKGRTSVSGPVNRRVPAIQRAQALNPDDISISGFNPKHIKLRQLDDGTFEAAVFRVFGPQSKLEPINGNGISADPDKAIELAKASALFRAMKRKKLQQKRRSLIEMFQQTLPMD